MIPTVAILFYLAALVLFVLGALLTRKPQSTRGKGGATFLARRRRKLAGITFMVGGLVSLVTGLLTQAFSSGGTPDFYPDVSSTDKPKKAQAVATPSQPAPSIITPNTPSSGIGKPTESPSAASKSKLADAFQLVGKGKLDAGLEEVNAILADNPRLIEAYALRGDIYSSKENWPSAANDFQTILKLDDKNAQAKFNLAEVDFRQTKYADARKGFVTIEKDSDLGDLSAYKVFLCDLLGGQEDVAAKELDAFNQIGENASYYFANAAWSLYHKKPEDARGWLISTARIYPPYKIRLYSSSLFKLGYLPLPPPPPN